MKAMILAAGFGTRLHPLTLHQPKALIEVGGKSLLEWIILKLIHFGISSIIINVHHCAEMIEAFLRQKNYFGVQIELSRETTILGTGGGIKKAEFFLKDVPWFLVHNVDVLSTVNLKQMLNFHLSDKKLATLFVQNRTSKRYLIFNENKLLCGHYTDSVGNVCPNHTGENRLAFNGIHVLSSKIFHFMKQAGYFSIMDTYLKGVAAGEKIVAFQPEDVYWRDVGRLATLESIQQDFLTGRISNTDLIGG